MLRTAIEIFQVPRAQVDRGYPVDLRGVVTCVDAASRLLFVQDKTAGIYLWLSDFQVGIKMGDEVRVQGQTGMGRFSPIILVQKIEKIGPGTLPEPQVISLAANPDGRLDSQWVELEAVVQTAVLTGEHLLLDLGSESGSLKAMVLQMLGARTNGWVDARVRFRGVYATRFDQNGRLTGFQLIVPNPEFAQVLTPGTPENSTLEPRPIRSLTVAVPGATLDHRLKIKGQVLLHWPRKFLVVADDTGSIRAQCDEPGLLTPGDRVEVIGFLRRRGLNSQLIGATVRREGSGPPPVPKRTGATNLLRDEFENQLVQVEADLMQVDAIYSDRQVLHLRDGGATFTAILPLNPGPTTDPLTPGSRLLVSGVREGAKDSSDEQVQLWLPSRGDAQVLRAAREPVWRRVGQVSAMAGGLVVIGLVWAEISRRRMAQQTAEIRQREAVLEERCQDLFGSEAALKSSEQELRRVLADREQLGRDLHDGIIQSIYAIGLALDECRQQIRGEPDRAEKQLGQSLRELNTVIRDVRNFILGLQPEALRGQELASALKSLALTMDPSESMRFELKIDPAAAQKLLPRQAVQLLHIAREAMSNSVRHGQGERTVISLARQNFLLHFEVQDDGVGFNPAVLSGKGDGLRNLAARARELHAKFELRSSPGKGTSVALEIPLHDHDSA
jgi:signal transduction histidine kinase